MKLQHNVPLSQHTSLRAGGIAETLISLEAGDDIRPVISEAAKPAWVLGYGTNILVSDKGLPGTVILNQVGQIKVNGDQVSADSGANWDELIQAAIAHQLWGLEFTSGIPGGVGAAVAGSIAAYGHRVSARFVNATMLDVNSGMIEQWDKLRFNFAYRSSDLQLPQNSGYVVLDATFQLSNSPMDELEYESALKAAA
jgi:UDP-N-acetylmuramate dehydrogenase